MLTFWRVLGGVIGTPQPFAVRVDPRAQVGSASYLASQRIYIGISSIAASTVSFLHAPLSPPVPQATNPTTQPHTPLVPTPPAARPPSSQFDPVQLIPPPLPRRDVSTSTAQTAARPTATPLRIAIASATLDPCQSRPAPPEGVDAGSWAVAAANSLESDGLEERRECATSARSHGVGDQSRRRVPRRQEGLERWVGREGACGAREGGHICPAQGSRRE